jgi:hypothetical protein
MDFIAARDQLSQQAIALDAMLGSTDLQPSSASLSKP